VEARPGGKRCRAFAVHAATVAFIHHFCLDSESLMSVNMGSLSDCFGYC
jgi:hypothetical protein